MTNNIQSIANTIRGLSIDAIEAAGCGHPGLPLGCADITAVLFSQILNYNPKDPQWINRDRFVLSAGHGSMLLYSALHLAGYDVTLNQIKQFRQLHSPTAGHPEYGELPGIETTTGPLGQGIAASIGMAIGDKLTKTQFNLSDDLISNHTYILAGDGCLMEGVSGEASSLAGHLQLDNLTIIYDANDICLDGPISECFSEDVAKRYEAYGWDVTTIDGHDISQITNALTSTHSRPHLIVAKTTIGYGSPNRQGTSESHGKALGDEESALTKQALGIPESPLFHVPENVTSTFADRQQDLKRTYDQWTARFENWQSSNPELATQLTQCQTKTLPASFSATLENTEVKPNLATRASSSAIIQLLHDHCPHIIGGSADLSCSDSTFIKQSSFISANDFTQRNIKYGVREFAMAAIATGIQLQGVFQPFCGTFLTFSDYMKNAIRLASLMKQPIIFQFTHDSVLLGEDGPTHQPVEHLASLRSMPGLTVIRPADTTEVKAAWYTALTAQTPTALILSRQGAPDLENTSFTDAQKGAYVVHTESKSHIDCCLLATGTEVKLALDVAQALETNDLSVRVVSFPSFELFNQQSKDYQDKVLGKDVHHYAVIEAQSSFGWHQYIGKDGSTFTMDSFGLSAPASDLKEEFGFTVNHITNQLTSVLSQQVTL